MVSAETALAIPSVLLVLALCLAALQLGVDRVRCVDAARVVAREAARGETASRALADGARAAPDGARISTARQGRDVVATVRVPAPAAATWITGGTTCRAVARMEVGGDG